MVSRSKSDATAFDISTKSDVDGTLTCHGDGFRRFEAHLTEPASAKAREGLERLVAAALKASLGWDGAKSKGTLREMGSDARDYLAASSSAATSMSRARPRNMRPAGSASA